MSSSTRVALTGVGLGLVPVVLAWFVLMPASTQSRRRVRPIRPPSLEEVQTRLTAPPMPRAQALPEPARPPANPVLARRASRRLPLPEDWLGMREEIAGTLTFELAPPRAEPTRRDLRLYNRRTRERRQLLNAYEAELVDFIETEADPYVRLDAEVLLAEVYLEQADVLDRTWIPDALGDRQARRRIRNLENRAAIARDKALMVTGIAQTEAEPLQLPVGDEVAGRLEELARGGG